MTTMPPEDRTPALDRDAFDCPHCEVFAHQDFDALWARKPFAHGSLCSAEPFQTSICAACRRRSFWCGPDLIYPRVRVGQLPNPDMPEPVQAIYDEAREVAPISAKSAAGLLRLALQMLIDDLEPGRDTIDNKIKTLVGKGLDPQVQQAMDVLRVVGNEAVHPGTIDLDSDPELVASLFALVNLIVEQVITRPKHVGALFDRLPQAKKDAIQRRDAPPS